MSSEPVVEVIGLGKHYALFERPSDRLKQMLWGGRKRYYREFAALDGVDFTLARGEALGLIGRNGAGKSTLLQLICGTLTPTHGSVTVRGRVAALLELGAGFNPDFTGHENIYLNASLVGLSPAEISRHYDEIVAFADIGDFLHQPVKTYSSGMYVRLAFAIATSIEPDILVIDEALSVGDGAFARKSFDRIMALMERGATVLFCSHSMFHVESICERVLWLDQGRPIRFGEPNQVVPAYESFLVSGRIDAPDHEASGVPTVTPDAAIPVGSGRLKSIVVAANGERGQCVTVRSGEDTLAVEISFASDPALPTPTVAVAIHTQDHRLVASSGTWNDGWTVTRDAKGSGSVAIHYPGIPLLKGRYTISVVLFCERGLHTYDAANHCAFVDVQQDDPERGIVALPHTWRETGVDPACA